MMDEVIENMNSQFGWNGLLLNKEITVTVHVHPNDSNSILAQAEYMKPSPQNKALNIVHKFNFVYKKVVYIRNYI